MTYLKQVFQNIEEVDIMSSCKPTYISFILEKCPNVRRINLGASAELDNGTLSSIMAHHGLRKLEVQMFTPRVTTPCVTFWLQ